jgi:hypothetical protein
MYHFHFHITHIILTSGRSLGTFYEKYYDIFAQCKNCEARQTVVASERLGNNIRLQATAAEQTTEQSSLTGSKFLIMQQLDYNNVILAGKL